MSCLTMLGEDSPPLGGPGATCHLLDIAGKRLLVDCGTRFGKGPDGEKISIGPDLSVISGKRIDLAFLTHVHLDHMGYFPVFTREHPGTPVLTSSATARGNLIQIGDASNIQRRAEKNARLNGEDPPVPLYTVEDANRFMDALDPIEQSGWLTLADWSGWRFGFYSSGHTVGAMSIYIESPEGYFVITGDCSAHDQPIVPGVLIPPDSFLGNFVEKAEKNGGLTLITEATNGVRTLPDMMAQDAAMVAACMAARDRGGATLFHVFAEGRSANDGMRLAPYFPVHIDGMARDWWRFYESEESCWMEGDEERAAIMRKLRKEGRVMLVEGADKHEEEEHRLSLISGTDKCGHGGFSPIIAPSATMEHGTAVFYGQRILPKRDNLVISTGHRFADTPGEEIFKVEKGRTVRLGGVDVPVSCETAHFDFSAHDGGDVLAKRAELLRAKRVIMHHGDDTNLAGLKARLLALPEPPTVYSWRENGCTLEF